MEKSDKIVKGVVVPMITPLTIGYHVDTVAVERITQNIVAQGASPFIIGSTGEGPSLGLKQKKALVEATVKSVGKKALIYAGLNANSYTDVLDEAHLFAAQGVDILVLTLPYYFPIDELQMVKYFEKIADASPVPIVLYNMPAMVKRSIPLEVAEQLSAHPAIVGMKDSERYETRMLKSIQLWKDRPDFSFLIGWAAMSYRGLLAGADGIVPSTGNLFARHYVDLYQYVLNEDLEKAQILQELTNSLSAIYQGERNLSYSISALKVLMAELGWCESIVMPPMLEMDQDESIHYIAHFRKELKRLGVE